MQPERLENVTLRGRCRGKVTRRGRKGRIPPVAGEEFSKYVMESIEVDYEGLYKIEIDGKRLVTLIGRAVSSKGGVAKEGAVKVTYQRITESTQTTLMGCPAGRKGEIEWKE